MNPIIVTSGTMKKKRFLDVMIHKLERWFSKHPLLSRAYILFFQKMTIEEFKMVDLMNHAHVLNIGCGPIPNTLITLAQVYDWCFTGVDCDEIAVKQAKAIVEQYSFTERIQILVAEGMTVDVNGYDLIFVSYGVEPKKQLLECLASSMPKDSMILYRTTSTRLTKVYGIQPVPSSLKIICSYDRVDGLRSLLLKRSENNK